MKSHSRHHKTTFSSLASTYTQTIRGRKYQQRNLSSKGKGTKSPGKGKGTKSPGKGSKKEIVAGPNGCPATSGKGKGSKSGKKSFGKRSSSDCGFDSLAAFGDSIFDVGSLVCPGPPFGPTQEVCDKFVPDRISNGLLIPDYLSQFFDIAPLTMPGTEGGSNFAFAGATLPALGSQFDSYETFIGGDMVPSSRLHIAHIGSNDVSNAGRGWAVAVGQGGVDPTEAFNFFAPFLENSVKDVYLPFLMQLLNAGACNVLIFASLDPSNSPNEIFFDQGLDNAAGTDLDTLTIMAQFSVIFNDVLQAAVEGLETDFEDKCSGTDASFGIAFLDISSAVESATEDFNVDEVCNDVFVATEEECLDAGAQFFEGVPPENGAVQTLPLDDGNVFCSVRATTNLNLTCSCGDAFWFDEIHPVTDVYYTSTDFILDELIDNICETD